MASEASPGVDPDRILEQQFTTVRRGLDPLEVQRYLLSIANDLRASAEREAELRARLQEAEKKATPVDELDPARLTALLGEETARVLDAARTAAAEIKAKAEENVARLLREARDEAQRTREEADAILGVRTSEADAAAAAIRAEADGLIDEARAEAARLTEAGRQEGREMVAAAQDVRQRMLDDLARRRKQLRQQIEQLQAGRERLVAAYEVVRETLDVATEELHVALPEAKLAAETASLRAAEDDEAVFAAEIEAAARQVTGEAGGTGEAERPSEAGATAPPEADEASEVEADVEVEVEVEASETSEPEAAAPSAESEAPSDADAVEVEAPVEPEAPVESETATGSEPEGSAGSEGEVTTSGEPAADAPEPAEEAPSGAAGKGSQGGGRARRARPAKADDVFARLRESDAPTEADDAGGAAVAVATEVEVVEVVETEGGEEPAVAADPAAELLARRDAAIAEIEKNLARRIKRELSDEQNELLDALRRQKGRPDPADVLPTPEAHVERFASVTLASLAEAATAGADLVSTTVGPPASRTTVADLTDEVAADLVGPLRERLERAFTDGDGDTEAITQTIRATYREWKGQRVDLIASHAVVAACNRGLLDRLPDGTKVRWVVDDGDTPSPDCEDNALAGELTRGEAFPTGHTAPPVHPTCRCLVVPA